ncbi:unnamed protein product [Caretta caretta]
MQWRYQLNSSTPPQRQSASRSAEVKGSQSRFHPQGESKVPSPVGSSEEVTFVEVTGFGAVSEFQERQNVLIKPVVKRTFVQTDKPVYKPGQIGKDRTPKGIALAKSTLEIQGRVAADSTSVKVSKCFRNNFGYLTLAMVVPVSHAFGTEEDVVKNSNEPEGNEAVQACAGVPETFLWSLVPIKEHHFRDHHSGCAGGCGARVRESGHFHSRRAEHKGCCQGPDLEPDAIRLLPDHGEALQQWLDAVGELYGAVEEGLGLSAVITTALIRSGLLQSTTLRYNIPPPRSDLTFALSVRTECIGLNAARFPVTIQSRYTGNRVSTNMVLIKVKMLSGYSPVTESLEEPANAKDSDYYMPEENAVTDYGAPCL